MTQQLAAELLNLLMDGLREHGLEEVLTFALPETSLENQYSEFDDSYRYDSTESEVLRIRRSAGAGNESTFAALWDLLRAATSYFDSVNAIADSYAGKMRELGDGIDPAIRIELADGSIVNLSEVLENPALGRLASMMRFIQEYQFLPDKEFEDRLNSFTDDNNQAQV